MNAKLPPGWKPIAIRPEFRGPDFPGTEDFPNGWFKDGLVVSTSGTVYDGVEPHHIDDLEGGNGPSGEVVRKMRAL